MEVLYSRLTKPAYDSFAQKMQCFLKIESKEGRIDL